MKMLDKEEQLTELVELIFVPTREADRVGTSGVEGGSQSFYSCAERCNKEATPYGSREYKDVQ